MGDISSIDLVARVVLALAVVTVLPLAALWIQRKKRAMRPEAIRVATRVSLGRNAWMAVVEVEKRRLLIAATERGINLLTELDEAPVGIEVREDALGDTAEALADGEERTGLIRRLQDRTVRRLNIEGLRVEADA